MSSLDLKNKFVRVFKCQLKHLCTRLLSRMDARLFYTHPVFVNRLWYASRTGEHLHLNHPRDFNELLIKRNLQTYRDKEGRSVWIMCADKYAVREYVINKGLGHILNECYGVFDSPGDISFLSLPNQFVLKLTNGCGQIYFCRDKSLLDTKSVQVRIDKWIRESSTFGLKTGEWHYSAIKPRIIAEKYLQSLGDSKSIIDYKFHCIRGKVVCILVCYDRDIESHQGCFDIYDTKWNLTEGVLAQYHLHRRVIPRPLSFDQMLVIAETLSKGIDYVRVDLYEIDGKPVFGEMTFTPAGNIQLRYQPWVLKEMLRIYNGSTDSQIKAGHIK